MAVAPAPPFPDVELVLIAYLAPLVAPGMVDTVAPPDGATGIRVTRVGGGDDGVFDYPRVRVTCYAPARDSSVALGEQARQMMLVLGGQGVDLGGARPVLVDTCATDSSPASDFYENPERREAEAHYVLSLRRPRA